MLNQVPAAAPTREETIALYLELARFYSDWDNVSCEGMFNRGGFGVQQLLDCVTETQALEKIGRTRLQLGSELTAHGIAVGDRP